VADGWKVTDGRRQTADGRLQKNYLPSVICYLFYPFFLTGSFCEAGEFYEIHFFYVIVEFGKYL